MSHAFKRPDRKTVQALTNTMVLFSDDFGGAALDNRWTVLDGGQGIVPIGDSNTPASVISQAAIGTTTTGITHSVAGSALTVNMNTTNAAEKWFVSSQMFGGSEDITVILSKSQALAANSIFIGLAECDPFTGNLLLNPNLAGDFTNRGGVEFGISASMTQAAVQTLADSSGAITTNSSATFAPASMATAFETVIELHAEDVIASASVVDSVGGKQPTALRVSSQVPNDTKAYKLVMRFKNVSAPGSNTVVSITRVLVVDSQEMRVEIVSGRGDSNAQKGMAVNIAQTTNDTTTRWTTGASGVIKASTASLKALVLQNVNAAARYLQIYNKATAGIPGTDTPVLTVPMAATSNVNLTGLSMYLGLGVSWAVTTDFAGATAGASGDIVGTAEVL